MMIPEPRLKVNHRQIAKEEATMWLDSGNLRYRRQPFMAGVGRAKLEKHNATVPTDESEGGWQQRFMESHDEEFTPTPTTPWLPAADQALLIASADGGSKGSPSRHSVPAVNVAKEGGE